MFRLFKSQEMTLRIVTYNPIWKEFQPKDKRKPGKRINRNHGLLGRTIEAKSNSYRESSLEFSKRTRIYLGTGIPNATQVSTSFYQIYFRDQPKLNFGTKFLLVGKTVTTRNFRSFSKSRQFTIHKLLFIIYYSSITIHRFWGQFDIPRHIQKFYYSLDTIHFRKNYHYSRALFMSS